VGYFLRFVLDSTESEEAKVQMSFWADAKKFPERPAIKDTEEVIKQVEPPNNARANRRYKPCIEICLSSNLL